MSRPRVNDDRLSTVVRLPPALVAALDTAASDRDVSRNWLITRLLERGVAGLAPTEDPR